MHYNLYHASPHQVDCAGLARGELSGVAMVGQYYVVELVNRDDNPHCPPHIPMLIADTSPHPVTSPHAHTNDTVLALSLSVKSLVITN